MIFKQRLKPITKEAFRRYATICATENLEPTLLQSHEEISLYYNHPANLPMRMVCRLGVYNSKAEASKAADELYAILDAELKKVKHD